MAKNTDTITQMSVTRWVDKYQLYTHTMKYYLAIKKELKYRYDKWNNMDEPWKYYAKWKKPDTEAHVLCGSFYTKCQNRQIQRDKK